MKKIHKTHSRSFQKISMSFAMYQMKFVYEFYKKTIFLKKIFFPIPTSLILSFTSISLVFFSLKCWFLTFICTSTAIQTTTVSYKITTNITYPACSVLRPNFLFWLNHFELQSFAFFFWWTKIQPNFFACVNSKKKLCDNGKRRETRLNLSCFFNEFAPYLNNVIKNNLCFCLF